MSNFLSDRVVTVAVGLLATAIPWGQFWHRYCLTYDNDIIVASYLMKQFAVLGSYALQFAEQIT